MGIAGSDDEMYKVDATRDPFLVVQFFVRHVRRKREGRLSAMYTSLF